jgi:hypothetical protein
VNRSESVCATPSRDGKPESESFTGLLGLARALHAGRLAEDERRIQAALIRLEEEQAEASALEADRAFYGDFANVEPEAAL